MPGSSVYREFLAHPPAALAHHKRIDEMRETIAYMLKHGVGLDHAIPTREIVGHLQSLDFDVSVNTWQIQVLGPLREAGVYIGSVRGKVGMFLISNRSDAEAARKAQQQRIDVERRRLAKLERLMQERGW